MCIQWAAMSAPHAKDRTEVAQNFQPCRLAKRVPCPVFIDRSPCWLQPAPFQSPGVVLHVASGAPSPHAPGEPHLNDLREAARWVTVHNQECLFRNGHIFLMELLREWHFKRNQ